MRKKSERKNVKILPIHWRKLRQLAANKDMTLQAEIDAILGSFLDCTENPDFGKGK
jgi:predicted DNA-binding ribbon-helix-helix protein